MLQLSRSIVFIVFSFLASVSMLTIGCAPPPSGQGPTIVVDSDAGWDDDVTQPPINNSTPDPEIPVDIPPQDIDEDCDYEPLQQLTDPCCLKYGQDACGAGLYCAIFDGRTIATCHPEGGRTSGESCFENLHCASSSCN